MIAFNLLFIDRGFLTGPGYYAVQLIEHMIRLPADESVERPLIAYVQPSARHHFSEAAQPFLRDVKNLPRRMARVAYEQAMLPVRSRRDGVSLLFSPAFVSPMWGAPHLVVTVCDMYYAVFPEAVEPNQRRYWKTFIPLTARRCDRIITISDNSKADIEQVLPAARGRTISIPLASRFDGDALPPASARGAAEGAEPYVLMVANLTPNKNCEVVVDAVAALRAEGRKVRFIHAGKDSVGRLAERVRLRGAEGFVESVGKVEDEELIRLYQGALCVAAASFYEGFGMPAVEAQSLGAPLVCSTRGALPEAAGDGALFFDPDDAAGLAAHIGRLLDEPDLRADLILRGHASASRFSWERTARETAAVFNEVLRGHRA